MKSPVPLEHQEAISLKQYLDLMVAQKKVVCYSHIQGYEGMYEVGTDGSVRSKDRDVVCMFKNKKVLFRFRGKTLKQSNGKNGYKVVSLSKGNKKESKRVHQLVVHAFVGDVPFGKNINHKDGNKSNNKVENLEIVTFSENTKHAYRNRLMSADGEKNGQHKLTEMQVKEIRTNKAPAIEIAKKYHVHPSCIYSIRSFRLWRNI